MRMQEGGGTDVQQARDGETIYKGHRSYELMRDLQRGITFSIARSGREEAPFLDPTPGDFGKIVSPAILITCFNACPFVCRSASCLTQLRR